MTYRDRQAPAETKESIVALDYRGGFPWLSLALMVLGLALFATFVAISPTPLFGLIFAVAFALLAALLDTLRRNARVRVRITRERSIRTVEIERSVLFVRWTRRLVTEEEPVLVFETAQESVLPLLIESLPPKHVVKVIVPQQGSHTIFTTRDEHQLKLFTAATAGFEERVASLRGVEAVRVEPDTFGPGEANTHANTNTHVVDAHDAATIAAKRSA